jgi:prepilin-type processing-associated H-X9-DG protein
MASSYLYWLIIGCEIAFWVVLALALTVRYVLRLDRQSRLLLLALPGVDLLLLGFIALDLKSGRPAGVAHGLAAAYVGVTVAFGGITVSWADGHVAHWFTGSPKPAAAPTRGWPALRYELLLWARCLAAALITIVLVAGLITFVNDEARTEALHVWFRIPLGGVFFWFLFGPLWTLLFTSWRRKRDAPENA